ncbi:uncharacterized protein F4822DRAFT_409977 [Hypoxylon trugodes]|uniref:uncharacterized protein n=1 Tax=Hypoxylon trugodes TaxID=326681 RepID=UPI00218E4CB0|nr:uncharacterized protein F4822DRAFT_409977 [Hypoxylon trugodes]KAI1386404.1 hypothetical protein F4822DRAFT_409977 [Hypoxylon trugodes]
MMVARPTLASAGCSHCRLAILKLFTNPSITSPITRATSVQCRSRLVTSMPHRTFSSPPTRSEPPSSPGLVEKGLQEEGNDEESNDQNHNEATQNSAPNKVPWYLQVEPPRHVASIEPPPLPELPSDSPEIVGSLLEYISEELGLDELSVLDLRELDPPAALGPNLFMLFGTARSERHLNVSAGRLVRWLRGKHRVWAHADGLISPNERKLKLRRKAKRAKLLGGTDDTDDGIKTGWICVNLGTMGGTNSVSSIVGEDGRVAGFGVPQEDNGFTIVVQIMTESRRSELRLEALWKQALGRPTEDRPEPKIEDPLDNLHPLERAILSSSRPSANANKNPFNNTSRRTPFEQTRFYSTQQASISEQPKSDPLTHIQSRDELEQTLKFDVQQKHHVLAMLQAHLHGQSPISAQQCLGFSNEGQLTTPFLQLSKRACNALSPHQTWEFRLAIQAKICELGKGDSREVYNSVRQLVEEMGLYRVEATRQQLLQLLACIYNSGSELNAQTELALQLLKTVQQRGQPVVSNDILVAIIDAASRSAQRLNSHNHLRLIERLDDVIRHAHLPCMDESLIMTLMGAYARLRDWARVWEAWSILPRYLRPRSAAMYTHMYKLSAASGSASICTTTLRRCYQEMFIENPPVPPTGAVLKALLECIRVADPHAEEAARHSPPNSRRGQAEFVKLVRKIQILTKDRYAVEGARS